MDLDNKRIFITCGGGLGDMITYTPALRRLKELYPTCRITFMTKYGNHEVLNGLPYLDKVTYIKRGTITGRYRVLPDLIKQDIVVFTDWQPQLLFLSKLFGIPVRAGIPRPGHKLNMFLTKHVPIYVMESTEYAGLTDAKFISEALGVYLDGNMDRLEVATPSFDDESYIKKSLDDIGVNVDAPYIVLSPFANLAERNWPLDTAKKFICMVHEKYHIPVVITAPSDKVLEANSISSYSLAGRTTTMQLVTLIKHAILLVTPDSGPMHIAGAVGTKSVALFSKDLPSRWAPHNDCYPIYLNEPCSPCDDKTARQCRTVKCMRNITADLVMKKIENIL